MRQIFAHLVSDLTIPQYLDFVTVTELLAYRLADRIDCSEDD